MHFNKIQENAQEYINNFYNELADELKNRPVSSYPVIFEDEHARINRYIRALVKEVSFLVKDEIDKRFTEDEATHYFDRFSNEYLKERPVKKIFYRVSTSEKLPNNMLNSTTHVLIKENKNKTVVMRRAAIGGAVVGGGTGTVLGSTMLKALGFAGLGALSGGILASTVTYYYFKHYSKKATQEAKAVHSVPKTKPSLSPSTQELINNRKQEVQQHVNELCIKMNKEYQQLFQLI